MSTYSRDTSPNVPSFRQIDFELLEEKTGLTLSNKLRRDIRHILSLYEGDLVDGQNAPTKSVRREMEQIARHCEELESILRIQYESNRESQPIKQAAWKCSSPNSLYVNYNKEYVSPLPEDMDVAVFLMEWKRLATEAAEWEGLPGRSVEVARRRLVKTLHEVFLQAGGKGRQCYADNSKKGGYGGSFFVLVYALVQYTSTKLSSSQVGEFILEIIKT